MPRLEPEIKATYNYKNTLPGCCNQLRKYGIFKIIDAAETKYPNAIMGE